MDIRDHYLVAPFGWSVMHPGGNPAEVEARVEAVREDLDRFVGQAFGEAGGYAVAARARGDEWSASVSRGDFAAMLTLAVDRAPDGSARAVRLFGSGGSRRLTGLADRAARLQGRLKVGGTVFGGLVFGSLCWLSIGVYNPTFVLGGLLMAVVMLLSLVGGASIGSWIAERIENRWASRVRRDTVADAGFQTDLKRWRGMARQIAGLRAVVAGQGRRQPFRDAAPETTAGVISSFSFSS